MTSAFDSAAFLPALLVRQITEYRVGVGLRSANLHRHRRPRLTGDGKLFILAADHPARMVTAVGNDPLKMADRADLLARVVRVLVGGGADGVLASMDLLQDLMILDILVRRAHGPSFLNHRVLLASLNRGGFDGASWELEDPMTGPRPSELAKWRLDGGKVLLRIDLDDPRSVRTLSAVVDVLRDMNAEGLHTFVEPLPVVRKGDGFELRRDTVALAKLVSATAALGDSSHLLWLKLPWCEGFEAVTGATTLPIVLLGGPAAGSVDGLLRELDDAMGKSPNVLGAVAGRNVLYPGEGDPLAAAIAVRGVVHDGRTVEDALAAGRAAANDGLDALTIHFEEVTSEGIE
jgi:DhnA family fructose-bisphosphate aldolase class Ia